MNYTLKLTVGRQGLYDITHKVAECVASSGINEGLVTLFIRHTSASLLIQENADPSVQRDLENWLNRLVAENDPLYTHTIEGPDDMPAHVKASMMGASVMIPIGKGRLQLGTWQGIYLCEHRDQASGRSIVLTVTGQSSLP